MTVKNSSRVALDSGRVNQKLRTRDHLVAVAAELIREGHNFSVGDVADLARVGRTTAYRYFPTQDQLLAHAAVWKLARLEHFDYAQIFDGKTSPFERVDAVVGASDKSTRDYEKEYRTMLRVSLGGTELLPQRTAFRREILAKALCGTEATLGRERLERVISAICMVIGIEALVVTRDVCLLSPERSRQIKRWAADALLRKALAEATEARVEPRAEVAARPARAGARQSPRGSGPPPRRTAKATDQAANK
jgi:AcrR family transcriptional regulator